MCYKAVKPSIIHCTILRACCRSCAPDWNASIGRFPDDKAGVPEQINYLQYPVGWCDQIVASSTDSRTMTNAMPFGMNGLNGAVLPMFQIHVWTKF